MNLHNGGWYLFLLCCIWPLAFHFAIVFGPRIIRNLINRVPPLGEDHD